MLYRVRIQSYFKIILLYFVMFAALPGAVFLAVSVNIIVGIGLFAVVIYVIFIVTRSLKKQLVSYVETYEDGISFNLYDEEKVTFPWNAVTCSGICKYRKGSVSLFVYNEGADRFIEIPEHINGFSGLNRELSSKTRFITVNPSTDETLKDKLRDILELK
ncbi:MAG: hypothetical protein GXP33_16675 [Spirochaetes bacterium]|nr:hypothetical protein [Spirochaetota bacterium]